MKNFSLNLGLLILRFGFSIGLMTHGYGKFLRVINGNFKFGDPLGIGATPSLILASFGEFIAPIFIIIGFKTKIFSFFPIATMLVAALIVHSDDPFAKKELALLYLFGFLIVFLMGPGKYSIDKR